ncbi:hypothetical protein DL93DRAFT_2093083 [Clavulina sp. PMI_390]|nr:hypothetical protein DL93DRAFT_2093083 [Clavulina sp. PMI_390]
MAYVRRGSSLAPISYPTGDVTILSSDGKMHKVHSFILFEAAGYFMERYNYAIGDSSAFIEVQSSTETLNYILGFLYPRQTAPTFPSHCAKSVFTAVEGLGLTSHALHTALTTWLIQESHPIRAWAIASRFGYTTARKAAVERYIRDPNEYIEVEAPSDLSLVPGQNMVNLIALRRNAISAATKLVRSIPSMHFCGTHSCKGWLWSLDEELQYHSPFSTWLMSERTMYLIAHKHCSGCAGVFDLARFRIVERQVKKCLEQALEKEGTFWAEYYYQG